MLLPEAFDQLLHLDAGQRIQGPQGFVQQQQTRLVDQRTGQGHALLLATGERRRPLICTVGQAHRFEGFQGTWAPVAGQPQADVVDHPLPGQQARVLEHQARFLAGILQRCRAGQQFATRRLVQARKQTQQGALAAAAATDHGDELAGRNQQVDALEHFTLAEGLADAAQRQRNAALELLRCMQGGHAAPPLA
ncbi:hypothetical protein D9M72_271920 [compost metagenome]